MCLGLPIKAALLDTHRMRSTGGHSSVNASFPTCSLFTFTVTMPLVSILAGKQGRGAAHMHAKILCDQITCMAIVTAFAKIFTTESRLNMLLQCLVYACQVEPIVPEQEVVSLVKLLHGMAKDFPGSSCCALCVSSHCMLGPNRSEEKAELWLPQHCIWGFIVCKYC